MNNAIKPVIPHIIETNKAPRCFEELSTVLDGADAGSIRSLNICVVTNELVAFHKNGGLGTATTGLVDFALKQGCGVTIVYTAWLDLNLDDVCAAIARLRSAGAIFLLLQDHVPRDWIESPRKISYACYWLLRTLSFDVIHFNDYLGNGFYTAQAKHTGCNFAGTVIITIVHGPTRWASRIDERPIGSVEQQEICFLEERTLELSDVVLGVSHHLLHWLTKEGVSLPERSYVHKNIMPTPDGHSVERPLYPGMLNEVVFFARQDVRKGFVDMLKAICVLGPALPYLKFTFLGKFSRISEEHSGALALAMLHEVPNLICFKHNLDREAALRYLRRPGVLAVMPSLDENSPCTVIECINDGIPFIATDVGGIAELIAPRFHSDVLFKPSVPALVAKVQTVAENGLGNVELGFDPATIAQQMLQGFSVLWKTEARAGDHAEKLQHEMPFVSVVITHFNRPDYLDDLLTTLEDQTYGNFEVIVVDDGSSKTAAMAYIAGLQARTFKYPHKVIRTKNNYLGAARNTGVRNASGKYIKFQDDDNIPFPGEIEALVRAALACGADIVTCMSRFFSSDAELDGPVLPEHFQYFPLGASLPLSLTHNEYGDANALVRRQSFIEDGGFTEIYGVGSEDYEFFLKSESLGRKIVFVPEPLFNYRVAGNSMLQSTSIYQGAMRARSGMRLRGQRWLRSLVDFAHEAELGRDIRNQAWWRAGKRSFGQCHQQMLQGDPGSSQNISNFLELAASYGRLEDVVHMILGQNSLLDAVHLLEQHSKRYDEIGRTGSSFLRTRPRIVKFNTFSEISLAQPTDNLPVDWVVFRIEDTGLLVHPLTNRVTEVIVHGAVPVGAKRLGVRFSHRNVRGSRVRVSLGVQAGNLTIAELDWLDLQPGCEVSAVITLAKPVNSVCDLALRSTVDGRQDFCWTFADHLSIELAPEAAQISMIAA